MAPALGFPSVPESYASVACELIPELEKINVFALSKDIDNLHGTLCYLNSNSRDVFDQFCSLDSSET